MSSLTPAQRLVEAFGDCERMASMYTDDVAWLLSHSLAPNIAAPHDGKFYEASTVTIGW